MKAIRQWLLPLLVVAVLAGAIAVAWWPKPIPVDVAPVERATLTVTVDEDGQTRVKDRYVVFTPIAGRMQRIEHKAGDAITAAQTILTTIDPSDPALLDARALAEAEARVKAAEAGLSRAERQSEAATASMEHAQDELARIRRAAEGGGANWPEVNDAELTATLRAQEARAAEFAQQIATFELEQARAALLRSRPGAHPDEQRLDIPAPISGRILRVLRDSAGIVAQGTPLLEVGDPERLEIEVDVLSADAVRIQPGAPVIIEGWGGDRPLRGRVRLVEPSGFTKVSALGVEEQRVNVIIDFLDPPDARPGLGDGFRVDARIVVDQAENALVAPSGAFFRRAGGWSAFVIAGGAAQLREVTLGRRSADSVEVLDGLNAGQQLVVYPSDRVADGARILVR